MPHHLFISTLLFYSQRKLLFEEDERFKMFKDITEEVKIPKMKKEVAEKVEK